LLKTPQGEKNMKKLLLVLCLLVSNQLMAKEFIEGKYDMTINIGGKTFVDILDLKAYDSPINMATFGGNITGSIEVVGVFKSDLKGSGFCSLWGAICEFKFEITAHENGEDTKVFYVMSMAREDYLKFFQNQTSIIKFHGTAKLGDGTVLGNFEATRESE
jgi:hypothetical protein